MYDLSDRFPQLYSRGGHCEVRGVFSFSPLACYVYDWENRFLRLPLNGDRSILRLVLHCFSSMLVGVRLWKSISPVAVEWRSDSFAAVCSLFCSMLVGVWLWKSIFPVAVEWRSGSFVAVCSLFCSMLVGVRLWTSIFQVAARVEILFFAAVCSPFCSLLVGVCDSYYSLFKLPLPRSKTPKWGCVMCFLFCCLCCPTCTTDFPIVTLVYGWFCVIFPVIPGSVLLLRPVKLFFQVLE